MAREKGWGGGERAYPGLDVFNPPLQSCQLLIECGQAGAAGHICKGRRGDERPEATPTHPLPSPPSLQPDDRPKAPSRASGPQSPPPRRQRGKSRRAVPPTEGVEEVRDLLDRAGDHLDVLSVRPVLVDLALHRILLHRHDRQQHDPPRIPAPAHSTRPV